MSSVRTVAKAFEVLEKVDAALSRYGKPNRLANGDANGFAIGSTRDQIARRIVKHRLGGRGMAL